ncbi:MAG: putative glycoside hydrolase [Clostridiaceae bacterium]|nr:putative glycoside hydrolase [Clostridiaceae bacterium]
MRRRMNPFVGILIILIAASGITLLVARMIRDSRNDNGEPIGAATEGAAQHEATHTPTSALTVTPTQTPTPTPTPIPVPPTASIEVKGLYLTTGTVGTPSKLQHYVDLANKTEINAYVIDIKDDYGEICYETQVPLAVKHGAWKKKYDVHAVINTFHENNIKVIGRIVCFSDPLMPLKEPDLSLKNASGSVFKVPLDNSHLAWLDPSNPDAWQYLIDISKEAASLGFDELQYDYIRFPETTNFKYDMSYLEREKSDYINDFVLAAREQLPGITLSADIFGSICLQRSDAGGIGQTLETISEKFHYISPMIYPSHFANDSTQHWSGNGTGTNINGVLYPKPDKEPYNVIYNSLLITKSRLEKAGSSTKVRPYLQGFTADNYVPEGYYIPYGPQQYRDQIQAVYDAGYSEWIFWNARNTYVEDAFLPE